MAEVEEGGHGVHLGQPAGLQVGRGHDEVGLLLGDLVLLVLVDLVLLVLVEVKLQGVDEDVAEEAVEVVPGEDLPEVGVLAGGGRVDLDRDAVAAVAHPADGDAEVGGADRDRPGRGCAVGGSEDDVEHGAEASQVEN